MNAPLRVFISYAHEDERHREALGKHLSALEREGLIASWHDRMITGGQEWAGRIDENLKNAGIVLLLISADFLDSDYCNDVELTEALRMHDAAQARVVPVILRSCDWTHSRFARLNALPPDGSPIVEAEHPDQRFTAVAAGLRAIVTEIREAREGQIGKPGEASPAPGPRVPPSPPKARRISFKIKIGPIEIGPLEFDWPPPKWVLRGLAATLLLGVLAGAGAYLVAVGGIVAEARSDMRITRYDLAGDRLKRIPPWLDWWPEVGLAREKAKLGLAFQQERKDMEQLGAELERLVKDTPNDADLLVIQAGEHLRNVTNARQESVAQQELKKLLDRATSATQADERHAEAWNLRGLAHDLNGDLADATEAYRMAADNGPNSPQYRTNYARILLDQGKVADAIRQYSQVRNYALARIEGALAFWAEGKTADAAEWQREGLKMLDAAALEHEFYNRRSWIFRLPGKGVELVPQKDRRCYGQLGLAASEQLLGNSSAAFPPTSCSERWDLIRELVAHDICLYVEIRHPELAQKARQLRESLGRGQPCDASPSRPQVMT